MNNPRDALFWSRALNFGATLIPIFFLHWVLSFLNLTEKNKRVIIFGYAITFIFSILSFSPYYITSIKEVGFFPFWPQAGPLYTVFIIFGYAGLVSHGVYQLIKARKTSYGDRRAQIDYIIIAAIIGFLGGATNFPFMYGYPLFFGPFGQPLVALYILILTLAITRYHLFDIRVILTELLVGIISLVLIIQAFTASTPTLKIVGFILLISFVIVGSSLISSVHREINYREQIRKAKEEIERAYSAEKRAKERVEDAYAIEKQTHEELKRLDEARKQFILATQHHLRTPLTIMKGYTSMILEGSYGKVNQKQLKPLEYFQAAVEKLIRLVNELLDISQFQMGRGVLNLGEVQIENILTDIIAELKPEIEKKGLYLKFEKPKQLLPKIEADSSRVKMALANIIDNGVKYTTKGGLELKVGQEGENIHISVKDTGIGMDRGEKEIAFGRFFERGDTAKKTHATGRGIGLNLSDQIFKAHKGKVWVESEGKGLGSTFHIVLPLKQPPTTNNESKRITNNTH